MLITILTPTYNRGEFLKKLYKSLIRQKVFNFQWLIVDDGSTDDTKIIVKEFKNSLFRVDYFYKDNGGKHTALNFAHPYILGEWVFVVDSDDILTSDAVELAIHYIEKYEPIKKVGAISFEKMTESGVSLTQNNFSGEMISNNIDYRINKNIIGDQAEIYRSTVFKQFVFPVLKGEKFLSESYLHINAAYICDTVYVSKSIYVAEYLEGGLTNSGRKMLINSPLGGMLHGSLFFSDRFKLKYRIKGMMLYTCYGRFANVSLAKMYQQCKYRMLFLCTLPFGIALNYFWRFRYK